MTDLEARTICDILDDLGYEMVEEVLLPKLNACRVLESDGTENPVKA